MVVSNAQLTSALQLLNSLDAVADCELPDVSIMSDQTFVRSFPDWRAGLQPMLDEIFDPISKIAAEAQANRRTAAALAQGALEIAALRQLLLASWAGRAAEACAQLIAHFGELVAASATALQELSSLDAELLRAGVTARVELYRQMAADDDQDAITACWQRQMQKLAQHMQAWQDRREPYVAALHAAAAKLTEEGRGASSAVQ